LCSKKYVEPKLCCHV